MAALFSVVSVCKLRHVLQRSIVVHVGQYSPIEMLIQSIQ